MPPKNKNAEEEAKRLEEERKKKEQEQALLELQRKKYLSQTLQTGLLLPASPQFIIDFKCKSLEFLTEKIKQGLKQAYPTLQQSNKLSFMMKQLHYYVKDSISLFGETENPQCLIKHRIFIGIMFKALLNEDPSIGGNGKNKQNDQKLVKTQVSLHCNKKFLAKSEGFKILEYAGEKYFGRYLIITRHKNFQKIPTETSRDIYVQVPYTIRNTGETKFIDLSVKEEQKAEEPLQQAS